MIRLPTQFFRSINSGFTIIHGRSYISTQTLSITDKNTIATYRQTKQQHYENNNNNNYKNLDNLSTSIMPYSQACRPYGVQDNNKNQQKI